MCNAWVTRRPPEFSQIQWNARRRFSGEAWYLWWLTIDTTPLFKTVILCRYFCQTWIVFRLFLYFHTKDWSVWFSDILLVTACVSAGFYLCMLRSRDCLHQIDYMLFAQSGEAPSGECLRGKGRHWCSCR